MTTPTEDARRAQFEDGYRAAVADVLWLAEARDDYSHPEVTAQTDTARQIARYLSSEPDEAWGWLPSWRWDEWLSRRMSNPELQSACQVSHPEPVTDAMVAPIARALYCAQWAGADEEPDWENETGYVHEAFMKDARAALEAARAVRLPVPEEEKP